MIITFDLSGRTRKELVKAISEITGERAIYKFMPTSAFEIGFFTVTREGKLEFPDRSDTEIVEQVLEGLSERGYTVISSYYDNGKSAIETDNEPTAETATQPDTAAVTETEKVSEETEKTPCAPTEGLCAEPAALPRGGDGVLRPVYHLVCDGPDLFSHPASARPAQRA